MTMFATPSVYSVTPSRTPFSRIPERASTLFREVKRRSVRIKRSWSFQVRSTPGAFPNDGGETKEKEIEDGRQMSKRRKLDHENYTNITPQLIRSMKIPIEASEKKDESKENLGNEDNS